MQNHWEGFFSIKTRLELREFLNRLDGTLAANAAFLHFAGTWEHAGDDPDHDNFNPFCYLSEDLSAILFGRCPVVFMGGNRWGEKPYQDSTSHLEAMKRFIANLDRLRRVYKENKVAVVVIPEKDYAISQMFFDGKRYQGINEAIEYAKIEATKLDLEIIFDQPLRGLEKYLELSDFLHPDSHLPSRIYINTFCAICQAMDLDHDFIHSKMSMVEESVYGDLGGKLSGVKSPNNIYLPHFPDSRPVIYAGFKTFGSPLGDTWQQILNSNPIVDADALVLGDSHSSIMSERRLTYLSSGAFRRVDFFWNPCGVRCEPPPITAEYVILEISSRFIF